MKRILPVLISILLFSSVAFAGTADRLALDFVSRVDGILAQNNKCPDLSIEDKALVSRMSGILGISETSDAASMKFVFSSDSGGNAMVKVSVEGKEGFEYDWDDFRNLVLEKTGTKRKLNSIDMRWTFGAHESVAMYKRIGIRSTGGVDGNARWVKDWLHWFDENSPALMEELGLNWLHCRFYKGMGWENEKKDFEENVKPFVERCHSHGVNALAYVQFGSIYPQEMSRVVPDAERWAQVGFDGKPVFYTHSQYFRYMPCVNCREWEDYIKNICTIAIKEGHFDGIMFDNMFSYLCNCERCQKSFAEYSGGMRIPVDADPKYYNGEVRDPVIQKWIQWRTDCTSALLQRFKHHIKSLDPNAVVSGNPGPVRYENIAAQQGEDIAELGNILDITIGQSERYPSYQNGKLSSRIRELKLARELGTVMVALCDVDAKMTPDQEKHYLLPLYEDLVFGGVPTDRTVITPKAVPGYLDTVKFSTRKVLLKQFDSFVRENRDLFTAEVYTPVRIFYPTKELILSASSEDGVCAAEEILTRNHIPWSYLVSTPSRPCTVPAGTEVIVVPNLIALSENQAKGLVDWAKKGCKLVVCGDAGRYDENNAQYLINPFLTALRDIKSESVVMIDALERLNPSLVGWTLDVARPGESSERLLSAIGRTGFSLPFSLASCPESVAIDVRKIEDSYVIHFINYDPSNPVKRINIRYNGRNYAIKNLAEYAYFRPGLN